MSLLSRMPVIIQGLGARSKVDAPTAGWDNAKRFVDEATARGAAVYSMAMSKPFNRTFDLAAGTKLYEGALAAQPPLHRGHHGGRAPRAHRRPRLPRRGARLGRPPQPRPGRRAHPAAARPGPCSTSTRSSKPENDKLDRPVARRHRRRARRAPHRRLPRHRAPARTSPSSSSGRPRPPSGSRARRSPRTIRT